MLLDEVGELPLGAPGEAPARPAGAQGARASGERARSTVDVRVLAATNRNVEDDVQDRPVPPGPLLPAQRHPRSRCRRCAIAARTSGPLAEHFLGRCAAEQNKDIRGFSPDALRALDAYAFPGNVRELENIIERAVALATGPTIGLGDLPREVAGAAAQPTPRARRPAPRRAATSTRCSARSSAASSSRRSSAPAACARRRRSCSASRCAASAIACRSTRSATRATTAATASRRRRRCIRPRTRGASAVVVGAQRPPMSPFPAGRREAEDRRLP